MIYVSKSIPDVQPKTCILYPNQNTSNASLAFNDIQNLSCFGSPLHFLLGFLASNGRRLPLPWLPRHGPWLSHRSGPGTKEDAQKNTFPALQSLMDIHNT